MRERVAERAGERVLGFWAEAERVDLEWFEAAIGEDMAPAERGEGCVLEDPVFAEIMRRAIRRTA